MTRRDPAMPRCDWREFLSVEIDGKTAAPPKFITALDAYFGQFAVPGSNCPGCGGTLFGSDPISIFLEATFRWGLVHGHGACQECGWPAIVHHDVPSLDPDEEPVLRLTNFGLAVHPDFVEQRSKEKN
jgi:hypothetical protein